MKKNIYITILISLICLTTPAQPCWNWCSNDDNQLSSEAQQQQLLEGIQNNNYEQVKRCVKARYKLDVQHNDEDKNTALLLALANKDRQKMAELFIRNGANPNQTNSKGVAPIHKAAELGLYKPFVMLAYKGADLRLSTSSGQTVNNFLNTTSDNYHLFQNVQNATPEQVQHLYNKIHSCTFTCGKYEYCSIPCCDCCYE